MQHRNRKLGTIVAALSMVLAAGSSRALVEDEPVVTPPAGGWGYEGGSSTGRGAADVQLEGVTVWGKRDLAPFPSVYKIYVPPVTPPPTPRDPGGPPDPAQQKACIDACDQKQKIANDLCAAAAAKAAANNTVAAIGIGYAVGAVLTWKGSLVLGTAGGFGAYVIANQLAKDHAATLNLYCIGKAAQDHAGCVTGTCKFSG
jgi:hypothetical protein